jgi:KaiC/GvpD/RAD55 family RecA-like ATPase/FixJ family two-component response regulator
VISTGVEALDARLGRIRKGDLYAFFGPGAAGKSALGLHFLLDGLDRNEACALITRDEPALIDGRATFLGYSARRITEHPRLRLVRVPDAMPPMHGLAPGEALAAWLQQQFGELRPERIVLDGAEWLAGYSHAPGPLLQTVLRFLRGTGATVYMLARTEHSMAIDADAYAAGLEGAAGVFKLEVSERGERRFHFHVAPSGAFRTEPFAYSLRLGGGVSEEHAQVGSELEAEDRRRVVVLDEAGTLSADVLSGLERQFDLVPLRSAGGALSTLSAGRYGALVITVDPYDEMRAFDLIYALRKDGSGVPIVFVAPGLGLRSSTRSRGLRAGADDFFVAELPAAEIIERIHLAWTRGRHRRGGLGQVGQIVQPVSATGAPRPMTESEFRQALGTLLAERPPLFFCYLEFSLTDGAAAEVWPALRTRVRVGDGDIIGQLGPDRFGCVLDRVTPEQTERVVDRIRAGHPALQHIGNVVVIPSPIHADAIRSRLDGTPAGPPAPDAAGRTAVSV